MSSSDKREWLLLIKEQLPTFVADQVAWKPPNRQANAEWVAPHGAVFRLVNKIEQTSTIMRRCGQAVVAIGAYAAEPSVGAIQSYIAKLLKRKLPYVIEGKRVADARTLWVFMEAALLIETQSKLLGFESAQDQHQQKRERWILKPDLDLLKSESRKRKLEVEQLSVSERLAVGRAEKAEEMCARARSELDVVMEQATGLEMQLSARRGKATGEVCELRREVKKLSVSLDLALKRADRAEERLGIALSELDLALKHTNQSTEQANKLMMELDAQRHEIEQVLTENDRLRERASRGYTATLSHHLTVQEQELKELRERRANNMGATKQLNLERARCNLFKQQAEELRKVIQANWGKDTLELAEVGASVPRLEAQIASLQQELANVEAECDTYRQVQFPPKPMERGHYSMPLRFMIMKLIAIANVCHTRIPVIIEIMASYFGIHLPGRNRKVLTSVENGVRKYKTEWRTWLPCPSSCENIRWAPDTPSLARDRTCFSCVVWYRVQVRDGTFLAVASWRVSA